MKALEFAKGSAHALALNMAVASADEFSAELRLAKAALLDWQRKYKNQCERVMFTVVSAPELHTLIESTLKQVYDQEAELAPLLHSVIVDVSLLDSRGKPQKQYAMAKPQPLISTSPSAAKPWWKFW